MKKYLFIGAIAAALTGCGDKVNTVTVLDAECKQVITGERGDVLVKCPITEQLTAFQSETPSAMFLSIDPTTLLELDAEHIYVDIVDGDCGEDTIGYRIMVQNPVFDGETWYAVGKCITK